MKIVTPSLEHLKDSAYEDVYEPAEDSFLMLDALEKELDSEILKLDPKICLEIGTGSGILSTGLSTILCKSCAFFATDINPKACQAAKLTSLANNANVNVINADLDRCLRFRFKKQVDILICNPPYVCTSDSELESNDITASWAGGQFGRNLTDRVIEILPEILSLNGIAYIVVEQRNNIEKVCKFAENLGLKTEEILKRKAGIEVLSILKFTNLR